MDTTLAEPADLEPGSAPRLRMSPAFFGVQVVLPMFVGGMLYILWRDEALLMFHWADAIGLTALVAQLREWAAPVGPWIPDWILYAVPDGCWVYSCTAFFTRLWRYGNPWMRVAWIAIGPALAIGGELGQVVGLVPGTFDPVDMLAYCAATVVAFAFGWGRPRA